MQIMDFPHIFTPPAGFLLFHPSASQIYKNYADVNNAYYETYRISFALSCHTISIGEIIYMALGRVPRCDERRAAREVKHANIYKQRKFPYSSGKRRNPEDSQRDIYSPFQRTVIMRSMKLFNVAGTVSLFAVLWTVFYSKDINNRLLELYNTDINVYFDVITWVLYAILIMRLGRIYHSYEAGIIRVSEIIYSQALANLFGESIIFVLFCIIGQHLMNPLPMLAIAATQSVWSALWGVTANKLYFYLNPPQPTVIIYKAAADLHKIEQIRFFSSRFNVQDQIEDPEDALIVLHAIHGNQAVFIAGIEASLRNTVVCYCFKEGIQCYILPSVGDIVMARAEHVKTLCAPVMHIRRALPSPEYLMIKRAFDIIGSMIGIIATSPIMLLTALAIKIYDSGPVLYKQNRLTKGCRTFEILKFRSMRVDAEKDGIARLACSRDDRITPVGKVIRAIRFDELPQLFNILKGDMTIVGPRPERPEIIEQYQATIPDFSLRLHVKAGLTGYAQVYGKYNTEPADKLQLDLMYINRMSLVEDIKIILYTIKILFLPESTEGVDAGATTALDIQSYSGYKNGGN